jgi:hypothetical protein
MLEHFTWSVEYLNIPGFCKIIKTIKLVHRGQCPTF